MTLMELYQRFPDDRAAEQWFVEVFWPGGVVCPHCQSRDVQHRRTRKPQPYRCGTCRKDFSVKTNTLMHASKIGFQAWAFAIFLMTRKKGISTRQLARDLGLSQKSAWHLAHRIRENWSGQVESVDGSEGVEVDETYVGGLERNKHSNKKLRAGRGTVGKTPVIGLKDRKTNTVDAEVLDATTGAVMRRFVRKRTGHGVRIYTDEHTAYESLRFHGAVKHSQGQYVDGIVHTNGIESFWAIVKRAYKGTYYWLSAKHLQRYVNEFCGRYNSKSDTTLEQMGDVALRFQGKRLTWAVLIA